MTSLNINDTLIHACNTNDIYTVKLMISLGATNINDVLVNVSCIGNMDIINILLKAGATDFNKGLIGACAGGNIEIVKLMLSLGANDFNYAFLNAAASSKEKIAIDIMNLIIISSKYKIGYIFIERTLRMLYLREFTNGVNFIILKIGKIPDYITDLTVDQLHLFYKNKVTPSYQYRKDFSEMERIEREIESICDIF
jgi:hypothetical protein